ncbi:MAG TPA: GAF domain-containing sensor histidine kinase, partial [Armatimonadota bacterium]|nr:GAF domain-containing sensor histidine kinase [Armatimonadota bacterium]
ALGAISFITAESGRRYGAADLRLAEDLARRAAVGIDNARLFAEAREARRVAEAAREALEAERAAAVAQAEELQLVNEELECQREELATQTEELQANQGELRLQQARLEFLLQVSEELGASLESDERVLQRLADLAVPVLCDWCVIDGLGDDGRLRRLGQAASDAATVELLREIETRYPPSPEWQAHPLSVLSSGHPQLVPAIPASELASFARDAEHLRLIRALDARSRLLVPLHAGGRPLGVLTLVMGRSGRTYSEVELSLAMELAVRVSMALDNARLYGELRQADRAKEDFLAMLAHELRNPLAPLRNAVEVLRLTADREAQERNREVIARQAEHMTRLVDDLLDMSRITRGKIELRKEAVPLCTLVERAVEACAAAIEAAGHQFEVSAPTVPVWLDADPTRLEQVLINLLGNAAKYTEPGGEVHLSVEAESRDGRPWAVVRVVDSGVGIAPELLPDIFDLFMQADRSLDRAQGGLGIGLTLVRNLVELHGGTVEAHSAGPGHGSEFVVSLPALAAAPEGA